MNRRVALRAGVFSMLAIALGACDGKPAANSASGTRIVVLSPAVAVTLKDLGLAGSIVGRHGYDLALDKAVPVCGDQAGIDYEALLAVKPTHVLVQWGARDLPPRLVTLAGEHGWKVESFNPLTLDEIRESVDKLAVVFDSPAVKARAGELRAGMAKAWVKHPGVEKAGKVLLLAGLKPPAALGPGSFHHQVLEAIGGVPAVMTGGAYQELDAEDVLRLAPEGIVIFHPRKMGTEKGDGASVELGVLAGLAIPAVQRKHVVVIDDPLGLTPSTAMIGVAEELAGVLEKWGKE